MIKEKINKYFQKNSNSLNTLLTLVNIFIVPVLLIWSKSIQFSLFVCCFIGFSNYKILKEAHLKNDKILKGDINMINKIMSPAVLFNYLLIMLAIRINPLIWIAFAVLVLFEINIIGEYYDTEEIQKLK